MKKSVLVLVFLFHASTAWAFQTAHLCGDSISRGYIPWSVGGSTGDFEPPPELWSYDLRSISSITEKVMRENSAPVRISYLGQCLGNGSAVTMIETALANGTVKAGDVFVIEDAGEHSQNPDQYEAEFTAILDAMLANGNKVVTMSMFDYSPAPTNSQYSTNFKGSPSDVTRTMNAASLAASTRTGVTRLDMKTKMDDWKTWATGQRGLKVIHDDGIHPRLWGVMRMAYEIWTHLGWSSYVREVRTVQSLINANWSASYSGDFLTEYWSQACAKAWARHALKVPNGSLPSAPNDC